MQIKAERQKYSENTKQNKSYSGHTWILPNIDPEGKESQWGKIFIMWDSGWKVYKLKKIDKTHPFKIILRSSTNPNR